MKILLNDMLAICNPIPEIMRKYNLLKIVKNINKTKNGTYAAKF